MITADSLKIVWQILYPITLGIFNFIMVIGFWLWFKHPEYIVRILSWYSLKRIGINEHQVILKNGKKIQILEKGFSTKSSLDNNSSSILLFLHGFGQNSQEWIPLIEYMSTVSDTRMLAIDILGHGSSSTTPTTSTPSSKQSTESEINENYELTNLLQGIIETLNIFGFDKEQFHVVGHSLGGTLAVMLANSQFSTQIELVTLISPFGFYGIRNEFFSRLKEGYCSWLLPVNMDEYRIYLRKRNFNMQQPYEQIMQADLSNRLAHHDSLLKIIRQMTTTEGLSLVMEQAPQLCQPVSILWGAQDEIIPADSAAQLQGKLGSCVRVDVLQECGHAVHLEQLEITAKHLCLIRKDHELKKFK